MTKPTLHIPILYGSQTGNSQSCAESLAESLPTTLLKSLSSNSSSKVTITSTAKQLDDFLEIDRASWPRFFIIVCSSYGVGQAPLGAWKFRDLCDYILEQPEKSLRLDGVQYAMLGLGDSKFTTFFLNPTALDSALMKAGAARIGTLGKADARGVGDNTQSVVMTKWCEDIIPEVLRVVKEIINESEDNRNRANQMLQLAKDGTCNVCKELFDDWDDESNKKSSNNNLVLILLVALIAVAYALFVKRS